jgi:hypothetical protein
MRVLRGGADRHPHERAHRPGNARAEVVGVLVLALAAVPRERAALLREEAVTTHTRGSASKRSGAENRRRCVQESGDAHREERRRQSALEPISKERPAAQRLLRKLAENSSLNPVGGPLWGRTWQ